MCGTGTADRQVNARGTRGVRYRVIQGDTKGYGGCRVIQDIQSDTRGLRYDTLHD